MTPDEVAEFVDDAYPIVSVTEYGSVLVVNRGNEINYHRPVARGTKKGLTELTKKARDYLAFVANATPIRFGSMMVCTYGANYPRDGRVVKKHLNSMLGWVRRKLGGEYLWFLEFQERGAPHVHILLEFAEVGKDVRYEFAEKWSSVVCGDCFYPYSERETGKRGTVRTDMVRVHRHYKQWGRTRKDDGLVGYVTKYATKTHQKIVPSDFSNVGRFYGWSRPVRDKIVPGDTIAISNNEMRWALKEIDHKVARFHIVPKYIFGVGLK